MLFRPHLALVKEGRQQPLAGRENWAAQTIIIVPRATCAFRRVDLKGAGTNAIQAATLKAQKEALAHENRFRLVPDSVPVRAGLWSFAEAAGFEGRYLPETLARIGYVTGSRLVACLDGYEGQVWVDKDLRASRWWPSVPTDRQWQDFLRAAQMEGDVAITARPEPQAVPFRVDLPRFEISRERLEVLLSPPRVAMVAATIIACCAVFLGTQSVRYGMSLAQTTSKIENVSEETSLVLSQRRRAIANARLANRADVIGRPDTLMRAFNAVNLHLKDTDFELESVTLRDEVFSIILLGEDEISPPQLVTDLENTPPLSAVTVVQEYVDPLEIYRLTINMVLRAAHEDPRLTQASAIAEGGS